MIRLGCYLGHEELHSCDPPICSVAVALLPPASMPLVVPPSQPIDPVTAPVWYTPAGHPPPPPLPAFSDFPAADGPLPCYKMLGWPGWLEKLQVPQRVLLSLKARPAAVSLPALIDLEKGLIHVVGWCFGYLCNANAFATACHSQVHRALVYTVR